MTTRTGSADARAAAGGAPATTAWSCLALLLAPLAYVHVGPGIAGVAAGLVAVVLGRRGGADPSTQRLATFALGLAVLTTLQVPFSVWVVVAAVALAASRWSWLRPAGGWLPAGEVDRLAWAAGALVVVGAAVALTLWTRWTETYGEGTLQLVDLIGDAPLVLLVPLGVLFVVLNAVAEEVAYRGIVQEAVEHAGGPVLAVVVQAALFGVLHVAGFPAGVVGMVLAAVYGLVLGVLRRHTDGLRAPILVHMAADTTIAVLVWALVVPAVA